MRTVFLLDSTDLSALKSGEPFLIQLANGVSITLQAESRQKRQPIVRSPKAKPGRKRRRTFSQKVKARILRDAEQGVSQAARKHRLSRSVIDRWRREKAAA